MEILTQTGMVLIAIPLENWRVTALRKNALVHKTGLESVERTYQCGPKLM
jgi:hypothetical protein